MNHIDIQEIKINIFLDNRIKIRQITHNSLELNLLGIFFVVLNNLTSHRKILF